MKKPIFVPLHGHSIRVVPQADTAPKGNQMNTHDMIELPPLPRPQVPRIDADIDLMDIRRFATWCEKTAKDYARAAIEADRQANNLEPLTPAEAVFVFASWLSSLDDSVTLGSRHNAAIAAELAAAFNESQGLQRFRDDFHKHIKPYPAEKERQARGEPVAVVDGDENEVWAELVPGHELVPGQELYASPQPQQTPENIKQAIQKAYGHLWMVNNEPGTPNQYSPDQAAYKARRLLRGILTKEERGDGINSAMLEVNGEVKP